MDLLLDYGDLGAIVRAGFSSPPTISTPLGSAASLPSAPLAKPPHPSPPPASDSSFPGFHGSFPSSLQLPSLSRAFDLLPPLPSPTLPHHFPDYGSSGFSCSSTGTLHAATSASLFSPSVYPEISEKPDLHELSGFAPRPFSSASSAALAQPHVLSDAALSSQHTNMSTLYNKPFDKEDYLASVKAMVNGIRAPLCAAVEERPQKASGVFLPNIAQSFLRPSPLLVDMEVPTMSTTSSSSAGAEKRTAPETELPSCASANRARSTKRRKLMQKRVVHVPAIGAISSKPSAGENVPSDMWAWRKYGQKPIKGSPHPRGYYRCSSSKGCPARKQVERNPNDPTMLVVTYTADHNHPWPTHRINVLAGSVRGSIAPKSQALPSDGANELSPSSTNELSPCCDASNSPVSADMEDDGPLPSPLSLEDASDHSIFQDGDGAASFNATSPMFTSTSALSAENQTLADACSVATHISSMAHSGLASSSASRPAMTSYIKTRDSRHLTPHDAFGMLHSSDTGGAQLGNDAVFGSSCADMLQSECEPLPSLVTSEACMPVYDEQAQLFDTLLGEMLEEVQRQDKAKVEVMMGGDDEDSLFNWSNKISFCSQVNHLVQ